MTIPIIIYSHSTNQLSKAKQKIITLSDLLSVKSPGWILTKGAFDLLHYGHISLFSFLNDLKQQNKLWTVVAIASDKIIKTKKGEKRPINPEKDRMMQVALLPQVDYVLLHDEPDYVSLIKTLQPDFYIKGMDTVGDEKEIAKLTEHNPEFGFMKESSQIVVFQDDSKISTSEIIKKVKLI